VHGRAGDLEVGEEWDVASPLDGTEQQAGRQLADVLDAHDVVGCRLRRLHALRRPRRPRPRVAARRRVRLGAQQHRDEAAQVRVAAERVAVGQHQLPGEAGVLRRHAASLYRYNTAHRPTVTFPAA